MFAAIKSEFRKLITVRSTYVIVGLAVLLVIFFAFYATGIRATQSTVSDIGLLANQSRQAILAVGLLGSLVGVLLVTHEYRYNTIMYTLTSSNSRTKTFLAKLVVITGFSVVYALFIAVLSPALTMAGLATKGLTLVPQHIDVASLLWQVLFVGWGYSMVAFILAMIIRIQVGAISAMFLVPAMLEPLLGLLLKKQAVYLPYNSLQSVLQSNPDLLHISPLRAAGVFTVYAVVGLVVAWQFFLRRDAS
jgi:ABC-type transport system involved in multi-copper enzyme maturation permease subunit